jgi:hypothetical protein
MDILSTEIELPVYKKLHNELKNQGRTVEWLRSKLDFSYPHTYGLLTGRFTLTEKNRQKMNELLSTEY